LSIHLRNWLICSAKRHTTNACKAIKDGAFKPRVYDKQ
jgi:hypothetical protein